jgi:hypothetical protein
MTAPQREILKFAEDVQTAVTLLENHQVEHSNLKP